MAEAIADAAAGARTLCSCKASLDRGLVMQTVETDPDFNPFA